MTGKMAPQSGSFQVPATEAKPREPLQGWIPSLATPDEVRGALDKAFDYRGDVTITLRNGEKVEGYIFDRRSSGTGLDQSVVRMLPKNAAGKISISYSDIVRLEFTGRDTAAGKSFELWVKKYHERKARGEKSVSLDPEPLD